MMNQLKNVFFVFVIYGIMHNIFVLLQATTDVRALNDINWNTIIISAFSLIGSIVLGYLAYLTSKVRTNTELSVVNSDAAKVSAAVAATKAEEVKQTLHDTEAATTTKLGEIHKIGCETRTLVNGAMGVQLRLYKISTRRIADLTNDPSDIEIAQAAAAAYMEHENNQVEEHESKDKKP